MNDDSIRNASSVSTCTKSKRHPPLLPNGIADEKVLFLSEILTTDHQAVVDACIVPSITLRSLVRCRPNP